ncbi:MAG: hypothetical protein AB7L71_19705 [Vicinamibacterales bacterium]
MFMSQRLSRLALVGLLCSSLVVSACDDDNTDPPTTPSPTTESVTWSTNLARGGATSRSFKTTRTGTVSVTLQALGASTTMRAGLGVGIPLGDGSGCVLSRSVETTPGSTAQLELSIDSGDYCVQVYDLGELSQPVSFTVLLVYPIATT